MTEDEQQTYHHNADEGETRAPEESVDPHHALNTPVAAIGDWDEAVLGTQQDEAERLEDADDHAEDERDVEDRARHE